jgi:serine/threonine protein kinase
MPLLPGTTLGAYEILSAIGAGGMGEVYLAQDTRLGRKVALKALPGGDADENSRRRFGQEARTASALNHPNIVTIFEIGRDHGFDYIAMEYVEGETLRALVSKGRIDLKRALDLAAQASAGLAAAHDAGIVHRDIKPENLIVGRGGQLKILDFGLAKLTDKQNPMLAAEAATMTGTPALTRAGTIVGTTAYMSPEQAQGRDLDGRTDIFSLGVVLYELLTGEAAFRGKSVIDILHAIINSEPRPATDVNPRLPLEVMEILGKALAKDPGERYRHAGDLALDLRRLARGHESASLPSLKSSRRERATMLPMIGALALGVAAGALGFSQLGTVGYPAASASSSEVTLAPLTADPGYEADPALSPDGETVAYVSDRAGNLEIFLQQVSGGAEINISNNGADDVQPAFSPDGRQIAFVSSRLGGSELLYVAPNTPMRGGDVWVMPALGGNARRIAQSGNFPSWSPDGTELLFTSGPWFGPKLYRVSAGGGEPKEIPLTFPGDMPGHLLYPRFSPDGRWIALSSPADVFVVRAEGGAATAIARGQAPLWGAESRSIVYSTGEFGQTQSLWRIPFDPNTGTPGTPQPLTQSRGSDLAATSSKDGTRIAFAAIETATQIESQPFDAESGSPGGEPVSLASSRNEISFFDVSRDGRSALFAARRGPASSIWRAEGSRPLVLLASDTEFEQTNPLWSPNGQQIAFSRRPTRDLKAPFSLWMMAADGANPQRLVERMGLNGLFAWMPDGGGIVHIGPGRQLHLLDLATKTERKLTDEPGVMPVVAISPDGQWVVYQRVNGDSVDLHAVPTDGGEPRVVASGPTQDYHPSVSPSGRWVYYLPDHKNLYRVPGPAQSWRAAAAEKVTNFALTPISFIENPQLSRDGRQLVYSRGRITSDVWLMTIGR